MHQSLFVLNRRSSRAAEIFTVAFFYFHLNEYRAINYLCLIGLVIGQITVGYTYIFAQIIYLICNTVSVIRDIKLRLPPSNIVRDACFTAITIGLIIIRAFFG